jgi:hypothetical protein
MIERIEIPPIDLAWSVWTPWTSIALDARGGGGVAIPNAAPGVYEVRQADTEERLTIGRASNLRFRIRQCLVKGIAPHSTGDQIRAAENLSGLLVRWAATDRPAAVEEELHRRHVESFGRLPRYTRHT